MRIDKENVKSAEKKNLTPHGSGSGSLSSDNNWGIVIPESILIECKTKYINKYLLTVINKSVEHQSFRVESACEDLTLDSGKKSLTSTLAPNGMAK